MSTLTIGLVLPDVLGTYGDDGNALVLRQRARMRGIDAEIHKIRLGEPVPTQLDVYCLGGGEDTAQIIATEHLKGDGGLRKVADAGVPIFAVCAGFQILGTSFRAGGTEVTGLELIDATTTTLKTRSIGEVTAAPIGGGLTDTFTGFVNHMGATTLGPDAQALGTIITGPGNTDQDQRSYEGATQGSIICTYMHGPAFARNPQLADLLLAQATGTTLAKLAPLDIPVVEKLRRERLGR